MPESTVPSAMLSGEKKINLRGRRSERAQALSVRVRLPAAGTVRSSLFKTNQEQAGPQAPRKTKQSNRLPIRENTAAPGEARSKGHSCKDSSKAVQCNPGEGPGLQNAKHVKPSASEGPFLPPRGHPFLSVHNLCTTFFFKPTGWNHVALSEKGSFARDASGHVGIQSSPFKSLLLG